MAGATNTKEAAILDATLDVSGKYIGLLTTMPTADDGSGAVEVSTSGTAYARVAIGSTDWEAAIPGAPTTKSGPETGTTWAFPAPSGSNWGNVKGFAIYSASTGGTMEWFGSLPSPKDVNAGDPAPVFNSTHQIVVQLGDPGDTF